MREALRNINAWRTDPTGWIGAAVMFAFAGVAAWRWVVSGLLFFGLLLLRDIAAGWFLLNRVPSRTAKRNLKASAVAYLSSLMLLMYFGPAVDVTRDALLYGNILVVIGFTIATIAQFELGTSFGVSPANRIRVNTGIYRLIQHPMYTGYVIAEIGMCVVNLWNVPIFALSFAMYWMRGRWESAFVVPHFESKLIK